MDEIKTMVFKSVNEDGINKAEWMASLKKGEKVVTRRRIKPEDECVCGLPMSDHTRGLGQELIEYAYRFNFSECKEFFPAKYAIDTIVQIAKREGTVKFENLDDMIKDMESDNPKQPDGDNVLCVCGHEKKDHGIKKFNSLGDGGVREVDFRRTCTNFKPALFKITGGMWHKDWQMKITHKCIQAAIKTKERAELTETRLSCEFFIEARLEGFKTVKGWLNAAEENKDKWGELEKSWRIELTKL